MPSTGSCQLPLAAQAILLGGHVRVGFEDNIFYARGEVAKSNAQLVERVVGIIERMGARVLSPAEARKKLGLKKSG
mgnify:CR=1 FL=1